MDIFNIASALFGSSRIEDSGGLSNTVDSVSAVGATASVDGSVGITMDADVTPADDIDGEDTDQTIIDVPTSPAVDVEDDLILGLTGDGPLKVPVVLANPGSGDRMQAAVTEAYELASSVEDIAQQAIDVANATGQHFWPDDDGVHVTEVTQTEWNDSTSPNYRSGANVLLNALGQLFRDGLNNLLALVGGTNPGVAIYDGAGNDAENIVASFTGEEVSLGKNSDTSTIDMCGGVFTFEVDNSDATKPRATIRVNASSGVTAVPTLRLTAGSGSSQYGFDIAGASEPYPIRVIYGGGSVVNMGGLGLQTYAFDLAGIDGGGTFSAHDGIYMVTNTGTNFWSTVHGTVLWSSGGWAMAANQTANLAYNVSTCPTGIVLHWQPYTSSTVRNYYHHWQFIPKEQVASYAGTTVDVTLSSSKFASIATKTLYVSDNRVTGHADNTASGTANGITYANSQWVLTQIIAV